MILSVTDSLVFSLCYLLRFLLLIGTNSFFFKTNPNSVSTAVIAYLSLHFDNFG
jgi:hypothetical protein